MNEAPMGMLLGPLHQIDAGTLSVGYAEAGPVGGPAVLLLHGWPYDIHSYADVAPLLASGGYRVIVPSCALRHDKVPLERHAAAGPVGTFPILNAVSRSVVGRLNNPNVDNVRRLFADTIGLLDLTASWSWQNCTPQQARDRLAALTEERHQIAQGVNPRPTAPLRTRGLRDRLERDSRAQRRLSA
jgi:hypothetical protein